jgi:beta-1,4-mannosyl-glycoprotein beta-1,4-N-acetylglucosaminyltransferase
MTFDAFLYFNEFELLCLRLKHMANLVDKVVILESAYTFTGKYKGFSLDPSHPRLAEFADRIVLIQSMANIPNIKAGDACHPNWVREFYQRDILRCAVNALASDGDLIFYADLDQFVDVSRWQECVDLANETGCACIGMLNMLFFLNRQYPGDTDSYLNPLSVGNINNARLVTLKFSVDPDPPRDDMPVELARSGSYRIAYFYDEAKAIHNCGHHFSSCGGKDSVMKKLDAYSHANENYIDDTKRGVTEEFDAFVEGITLPYTDAMLPEVIRNDIKRLEEVGFIYRGSGVKG